MNSLTKRKRLVTTIYAIIIVIITTAVGIGVYDYSIKEGTIVIDGKELEVTTKKNTVEELLQEQDIKLEKLDYINLELDQKLEKEFQINIKKAVPISIEFKDSKIDIKTPEETVGEVLKSLSINYNEKDKITPALNEKVKAGLEIKIVEVEEKIQTLSEEIGYKEITKETANLEKGKTLTVQHGAKGIKENKVKEIYENGSLISREVIESKVVREPVDQIVQKGTKVIEPVVASRGATKAINKKHTVATSSNSNASASASANTSLQGKRNIVMSASAYDLSYASTGKNPGDKGYGITASGTKARPGVVAVDPRVIPLGTKLYIESLDGTKSYGYATAEDTGGAIKGNRIDLFFNSGSDAKKFGRRNVKVYILN